MTKQIPKIFKTKNVFKNIMKRTNKIFNKI